MSRPEHYVGVDQDINGGMTTIGRMIRDAWVFGLIPKSETGAGWTLAEINALSGRVNDAWDRYGCLVSHLPPELAGRHRHIHAEAVRLARAAGWSGEAEVADDE
ncbi:MAG: hypothetical protein KDI15_01980 [Thiothrix sp.]|nr:hypothetical protein [Thiothrix sp.]HPE59178.1 hypothetical protein [Thiolinea sp.]